MKNENIGVEQDNKPWYIQCPKSPIDRRNVYRMLRYLGFSQEVAKRVRQWRRYNVIKYIAHHCDEIKQELNLNKEEGKNE